MKKKKLLIITIGILLLLFGIWNILWTMHYNQYKSYREKTQKNIIGGQVFYTITKDDYYFSVNMPSYLRFNGNLAASKNTEDLKDGISMIVWLKLFSEDKYGVILNDENGYMYQIYMDEKGKPIYKENESISYINETNALIDSNRDLIDEVYEKWNEVFGIRH